MIKTLDKIERRWQTLVGIVCFAMVFVGIIGFARFALAAEAPAKALPVMTSARLAVQGATQLHILELTFEGRPRFSMQQYKGKFYMQLRNIDNTSLPALEGSTSRLSQFPIKILKDKLGTLTNVIVKVDGKFRTEMSAYEKPGTPFRVVVEFYSLEDDALAMAEKDKPAVIEATPPALKKVSRKIFKEFKKPAVKALSKDVKVGKKKDFWELERENRKKAIKAAKAVRAAKAAKAAKAKKKKAVVAKKKTVKKKTIHPSKKISARKVSARKVSLEDREKEVAAFNDGWRWEYRKKVVEALRHTMPDVYKDVFSALSKKFNMGVEDTEQVAGELAALVADYEMEEETDKAAVLQEIIPFFQGNGDIELLDGVIRKYGYTGFTRLGRFVEGVYLEQRGFTPEALAYYSMTVVGKEDEDIPDPFTSVIIAEANFRMGIVSFMEYKMDKALNHFQRAVSMGSASSRTWLANTLFIKGQTDEAMAIYSEVVTDDPITRMNLADINIAEGDFDAARDYYQALSDEFSGEEVLSAFFMVRTADTYQIEGRMEDAERLYGIARDNLLGEGRAMASLAMAEILEKSDDHDDYKQALRYYGTVAEGNYIGTQEAYLKSAKLQLQLGNNGFAIALLNKMDSLFPLGEFRFEAGRLKGDITLKWLDQLELMGDDEGLAKIFLTYETFIPFGQKSGAYIKAGRAFIRLGFTTDAVKVLNSLVKMGKGKHLEEAMVLLATAYLAQEDVESADRLAMFFKSTFPKSKYKKEFARLIFEINYKKGQHAKIVATRAVRRRTDWNNSEDLMLVASSFFNLGKYAKAEQRYSRAAELLAERQENGKLGDACMGVAESLFMQKKYQDSIKFYRCAAELSKTKDKDGTSIDTSWATYRLAESNFKIGKDFEAAEALKSLKQSDPKMAEWGKYLFAENGK